MLDEEADELRLYLIIRGDIGMPLGKALAQAGHAFVGVLRDAPPALRHAYETDTATPKIAVQAKNLAALKRGVGECQQVGIPTYTVTDAGRTVFNEPTITCAAVGPVRRRDLPKFVERMRLA